MNIYPRAPLTPILASILVLGVGFGTVSSSAPTSNLGERTFDFTYSIRVMEIPAGAESVRVWIPLPQTSDVQGISLIDIDAPGSLKIVTESKYQNRFAYVELPTDAGTQKVIASYRVTRIARSELVKDGGNHVLSRDLLKQFLSPSRFIALDGPVALEARMIAGGAKNPLDIARRLYDNIVDTVRYDKSGEGWGRGDSLYACDTRAGNCTDFHSLFIGEARSLGVPARFVMGFPIPTDAPEGRIGGYHCWAEFYTPEYGWVPLDASDAFKYPEHRDALFGGLDENRVRFTSGRDITLPGMQGAPLNFSIYPYVEIDGKVHKAVETEYRYRNVE